MAKNKDINITPSKGISIVIKNDIQQPLPIKPKKKRRYKRINVLPKTPAPPAPAPKETPLFPSLSYKPPAG